MAELETYRCFRHRVRHLYSINLDGDRVLALAEQVPMLYAKVQQAVATFREWLTQQAAS